MSEYFPEPKYLGGRVRVELDLSNYTTKTDLKNAPGVDTSKFAKKVDLASLKSNVDKLGTDKLKNVPTNLSNLKSKEDKLDVDKLVPVPVDLSKLSDVVKNDVVKKDVYNAEDKVPDITNLAANASPNARINEVKNKIPNITNLATTTAFTAVENRIPNVSNLVKKTDYNRKISEIENKITANHDHDKYITTQEFNKLTSENVAARLKKAILASKNDIADFVKTDFDNKLKDVTANKNELKKLSKKAKAISTKGLT